MVSLSPTVPYKQPLPNQEKGLYFRSSNKCFLVIRFNANRIPQRMPVFIRVPNIYLCTLLSGLFISFIFSNKIT